MTAHPRRANDRAESSTTPQQRIFSNGRTQVIASRNPEGGWTLSWTSSMGVESVSRPLDTDAQLDEWINTLGKRNGFKELKASSKQAAKHAAAAAGRPMFSDGQFATLVVSYEKWRRSSMKLYDGPEDRDFQRAFRSRFGITWQMWERELSLRGMSEPPADDVREDVILEVEAALAEEQAADDEVRRNPELAEVHAEERRQRAEEGARRMSRKVS